MEHSAEVIREAVYRFVYMVQTECIIISMAINSTVRQENGHGLKQRPKIFLTILI